MVNLDSLQVRSYHGPDSSLEAVEFWIVGTENDVGTHGPAKDQDHHADDIHSNTWCSSGNSVDDSPRGCEGIEVSKPRKDSKWVKEAANGQTDGIYLFDVHKHLEVVKGFRISQIKMLEFILFENNLSVFDDDQDEQSCEVCNLKEIGDTIDSKGQLE